MAENLVEESPKQHRTDEGTQRSAGHVSTPAVEDSKNPASISKADVQRELDAVKAERRRRQRALLVARPSKKGPLPSTSCLGASSVSSSSQSLQPHPAQYDDGSSSCAIFTGKADTVKRGMRIFLHFILLRYWCRTLCNTKREIAATIYSCHYSALVSGSFTQRAQTQHATFCYLLRCSRGQKLCRKEVCVLVFFSSFRAPGMDVSERYKHTARTLFFLFLLNSP